MFQFVSTTGTRSLDNIILDSRTRTDAYYCRTSQGNCNSDQKFLLSLTLQYSTRIKFLHRKRIIIINYHITLIFLTLSLLSFPLQFKYFNISINTIIGITSVFTKFERARTCKTPPPSSFACLSHRVEA